MTGAAWCPVDGHASPLHLLRALHQALQQSGGAWLPGRTVDAIEAALVDLGQKLERGAAPAALLAALAG